MKAFTIIILLLVMCIFILAIFKFKEDKNTTYKQRLLSIMKLNSMRMTVSLFCMATFIYIILVVVTVYINRPKWDKPCHIVYENCQLESATDCNGIECVSPTDTTEIRSFYLDKDGVTIIAIPDSCTNRFVVSGTTTEYEDEYVMTLPIIDNERDTLFIRESLVNSLKESVKQKVQQS